MKNGMQQGPGDVRLMIESKDEGNGEDLPEEIKIPELLAYKLRAFYAEYQVSEMQAEALVRFHRDKWNESVEELKKIMGLNLALDQYTIDLPGARLTKKEEK